MKTNDTFFKRITFLILVSTFTILAFNEAYSVDPRYFKSRDLSLLINATVEKDPEPRIILNWEKNELAQKYMIKRKTIDQDYFSFNYLAELDTSDTRYVDDDVEPGVIYEYEVSALQTGSMVLQYYDEKDSTYKDTTVAKPFEGYGYAAAGMDILPPDSRRKVLLLVDSTVAEALPDEVERLKNDMINDGWAVVMKLVQRAESFDGEAVKNTKKIILEEYEKDRENLNTVFILGRAAVPYSGKIVPDGHANNHYGAWPADMYYGSVYEDFWTDNIDHNASANREENKNTAGDGKFDQSSVSYSEISLRVGRVDFYNMTAFEESEIELLKNYLDKDHAYRSGEMELQFRGLIDDNFAPHGGLFSGFAGSGWRNFAALLGPKNVTQKDWFNTLSTDNYLWAYGCGGGTYVSCGGVGRTFNNDTSDKKTFVASPVNAVFTMLFGSYFGDWDSKNNILRATLCSKPSILTCAWAGRPHWYFHHMAMGYPIGYAAKLSMNNSGNTYKANLYYFNGIQGSAQQWHPGLNQIHIALMGDPTLRMYSGTIPQPENVNVYQTDDDPVQIEWDIPVEITGEYSFNVYRLQLPFNETDTMGVFVKVNQEPLTVTELEDMPPEDGKYIYMVRTAQLKESNTGSFYNLSPGNFQEILAQGIVGVENKPELAFDLSCSPNPATENVKVKLTLPSLQTTSISVYDINGNIIKEILTENLSAGSHQFGWNLRDMAGRRVAPGVYIVRVTSSNHNAAEKIVVQR